MQNLVWCICCNVPYVAYHSRWKIFTFSWITFATMKVFGKVLHVNTKSWFFFGNEGKDMEQRKFFTANNEHYMVGDDFYPVMSMICYLIWHEQWLCDQICKRDLIHASDFLISRIYNSILSLTYNFEIW